MKEFLIILVSAILVDNFVLSKFMGICPFLGVSKKLDSAVGMSAAVIFVMVLATAATYLPLITTNCAVLGVTLLNIDNQYGFAQSLVHAFGAGVGFMLAMVLFSGVRSRIEGSNVPESFKGMPITLIAASIVSISFMGFSGIVENLFR